MTSRLVPKRLDFFLTLRMSLVCCMAFLVSYSSNAQTAPPHLQYFGFVAIDCFYDDPLDASSTTNYISEVDSFSNIAHLCVFDYTDNIVARTTLMNNHCVNPILHIQQVFFQVVGTQAPSGTDYDLHPNFTARWNSFKTTNAAALSTSQIGCFYIADEPYWNGISLSDLDTVCALLKADFPTIPILMVEAYTTVNTMQVPQAMDWIGFDRYGTFDPQTDPAFLENLDTLKNRLTSAHQRIVLIIDDQWLPYYGQAGYPPDTMQYVVQNYYDLAAADTNIIGLIGYLWPGGLDDPGQLGVRNLTPGVIARNVDIGKRIKNNFSPCSVIGLEEHATSSPTLNISPNPASQTLQVSWNVELPESQLVLYNVFGQEVARQPLTNTRATTLACNNISYGVYIIVIQNATTRLQAKVCIQH